MPNQKWPGITSKIYRLPNKGYKIDLVAIHSLLSCPLLMFFAKKVFDWVCLMAVHSLPFVDTLHKCLIGCVLWHSFFPQISLCSSNGTTLGTGHTPIRMLSSSSAFSLTCFLTPCRPQGGDHKWAGKAAPTVDVTLQVHVEEVRLIWCVLSCTCLFRNA